MSSLTYVSLDLIDTALEVMKEDSQAGSLISRGNRAANASWQRTPEAVYRCNHVLKYFGLPDLDTPIIL